MRSDDEYSKNVALKDVVPSSKSVKLQYSIMWGRPGMAEVDCGTCHARIMP